MEVFFMSIMKRNEFVDYCKKNAFESGDGFIFKPEWLNIIKDKDDDYKAWFYDVIVAYGILGYILSDMPNSMKVDMKPVIDAIFEDIADGNNPFASKLMVFEMEEFISDYRCYCDEVEELKEKEAKEV